jgi:hypothetical protein
MIVKISGGGKSFKGLSDYLTHDPDKAKTDERVAWTHTHNLANDDVPSAVNEMYLTAENAELLKQEAGVRGGGRQTENPAKHVSLNWAPVENPTREHMIETGEGYLRHMGWQEHQAILVAHDDKSYRHVHIMLNVVHPETGLRLNDDFEQRRSQAWALEYEREHNRIHCEQRLLNADEREKNMPRNMWMAFKTNEQEFSRAEKNLADNAPEIPGNSENPKNAEWKILKEFQKEERLEFVAQGKVEFAKLRSSIYREVREEFRDRWADYFEARRNGAEAESLATLKTQLVADQKAVLEPRRDEACAELRASRDGRYQELLGWQRGDRAELGWRQELGLDNADFFAAIEARQHSGKELAAGFREAAHEIATPQRGSEPDVRESAFAAKGDEPVVNAGRDVDIDIGGRLGSSAGAFLDSLFVDLTTLGSARPTPVSAQERADTFREAAENTLKQQQHQEREESDSEWRQRSKALYGE